MRLRDQLSNMSPREQKLLSILGLVAALLVFIGLPAYVYSGLIGARDRNESIRKLLRDMDKTSELLAKRKAERMAADLKFAQPAPGLGTFIESAASAYELELPESTNRPNAELKGYTERVTVVKLRKVNLLPLVKMLEKIERSGHPVSISQLNIKAKASGPDLYDVTLAVSAFDKEQATKPSDDGKESGKAGTPAPKGKAPAKPNAASKKGREL